MSPFPHKNHLRRAILALLCALLIASSIQLKAQQPAPPLAGIAHVAIRVHDLAVARAFYQSLGFEEAFDLRRNDIPYESFIKINDRQFLELYPVSEKEPNVGFLHLCFEGADLQAIHDDYVTHGLTPIAVRKAGAGNLLFTMPGPMQPIGPEGKALPQNIEYTQYMPGSLHSNDFGKHLGSDRVGDRLLSVSLAMVDLDAARTFYLNDLSFKPLPAQQSVMHLPGSSGQKIEIFPATLGPQARITFEAASLSKASRHLSHEKLKFTKSGDTLSLTDPDGNHILIQQR